MKIIQFFNRKFFIVCGICMLVYFVHLIPHKQIDIIGDERMPFLSHSLPFTKMPPKEDKLRVILIGNSVWETTPIVTYLLELQSHSSRYIEVGNFSMSGTSTGDYLFIYNYIRQFRPDLIVVGLYPLSFTLEEPLFRHKAHQLIFRPEMKPLWRTRVMKEYSRDEWVESFIYSHFPLYRSFVVWKNRLRDEAGSLFRKFLRIPVMDIMPPMELREMPLPEPDSADIRTEELEKSWEWLVLLVNQMEEDRQKAVFILQPTSIKTVSIYKRIPVLFRGKRYVKFYDLGQYFENEYFQDKIHPDYHKGSAISAARLFKIINRHLIP